MKSKAPKYCYLRKGRWVYIPYVDGKLGKEIPLRHERKLIRKDDPLSWVWAAWESLKDKPSDTLGWLIDEYLKSDAFEEKASGTKRNYKGYAAYLKSKPTKSGLFGDVSFESVTPGTITKLKDSMVKTPTACKHKLQFLSTVYSWAFARDKCSHNPCLAADKTVPKKPGRKYVEDRSFYIALDRARELESYLYPMMILAYCCRARGGEVSRLERLDGQIEKSGIKHSDVWQDGIHIHRSKGSLPEVTLWSEFLREGYRAATEYSKKQDAKRKVTMLVQDPYLIHDQQGEPISKESFKSAWARLIKYCSGHYSKFVPFTMHDIKAKGIDDHATNESGHKSERAKQSYLRKIKRTESTK